MERALSELRKNILASVAVIVFCMLVGGIVAMLHGWM